MTTNQIPTRQRLAQFLAELCDPRLDAMIERARAGDYDEIQNPATARWLLAADLRRMGYDDLAEQAENGRWEPAEFEVADWLNSDEAAAVMMEIFGEGGL